MPKFTKRFLMFERRRGFPRLIMEIPVTVTGHDGNTIDATLHDLSPDGAQISYPVADGLNLFPGRDTESRENSKNLKCLLQFKLESGGEEKAIKIHASSVYLRPLSKKTVVSGLFFDQSEHAEKKLIRDYLHVQLEESFADTGMDHLPEPESAVSPVTKVSETVEPEKAKEEKKDYISDFAESRKESGTTRSDMEFVKQELVRMQSSLKVIQETTRHIDEKLALLEQKIMRGH